MFVASVRRGATARAEHFAPGRYEHVISLSHPCEMIFGYFKRDTNFLATGVILNAWQVDKGKPYFARSQKGT